MTRPIVQRFPIADYLHARTSKNQAEMPVQVLARGMWLGCFWLRQSDIKTIELCYVFDIAV